ncbi:MAG: hypothetical protein OXI96_08200 [Acidimicrobiaceae bacterium]|nr:hypothetical protein [Acidimicrobiaceae bacterium]
MKNKQKEEQRQFFNPHYAEDKAKDDWIEESLGNLLSRQSAF